MIRHLKVEGLNNRLDDEFEFNEDLNIFTGPNGSCKTTLLKLIWYFISGHLEQILVEIPFHTISIQTDLFDFSMKRVEPDQVTFNYSFGKEESVYEPIAVVPEIGKVDRTDADRVNSLEKRIARTTKRSLFFPTFRRIEGGFSRVTTDTDDSTMRFRASAPEMLRVSMSEIFRSEVSINGHKFIASISTEDLSELLRQGNTLDIYEAISNTPVAGIRRDFKRDAKQSG